MLNIKGLRLLLALVIVASCTACGTRLQPSPPEPQPARLSATHFVATDGARLPLHVWPANGPAQRVLLAVHGFNDYGAFVDSLARFLAERGVTTYAYDQRGFGEGPAPGIWAGREPMTDDLHALTALLRERHPELPLYLFGESMGGALVLRALARWPGAPVRGVILSAPAVWGPETWPWYQTWALFLGAHLLPWLEVTGEGLDIEASDNHAMLRALGRDPRIIKQTRLDSLWGLAQLMDEALLSAPRFQHPALILYGARDELIPREATRQLLEGLPAEARESQRFAVYPEGYHMLTRDLQAERVWRDIDAWLEAPGQPLPSAADHLAPERLSQH